MHAVPTQCNDNTMKSCYLTSTSTSKLGGGSGQLRAIYGGTAVLWVCLTAHARGFFRLALYQLSVVCKSSIGATNVPSSFAVCHSLPCTTTAILPAARKRPPRVLSGHHMYWLWELAVPWPSGRKAQSHA